MHFHDICGNEHAKRAAEVALAGDHLITFIGAFDSEAWPLSMLVNAEHLRMTSGPGATLAIHWQPCACGGLRDDLEVCTCSGRTISQWYFDNPFPQTEIYVDVVRPAADKIVYWARSSFASGEPHAQVMARIQAARARDMDGPYVFDDTAWALLTNAANAVFDGGIQGL